MPFTVTDAIIGDAVIKQIRSASHRTGSAVRTGRTSGAATTSEIYGVRVEEVTSFVSGDIDGLLDLASNAFVTSGKAVYPSLAIGSVTVPYKNRAEGGVFEGTLAHSQLTGARALIIPTGIDVSQDDEAGASMNVEVHWYSSDGHADCVTSSTGNTLASEAYVVEFGLGIADINGTDLSTLTGLRINPGITLRKQSANGGTRPATISIERVEPSIDVMVHDIDEVVSFTDDFTAISSFECYLRKRSDGGEYVADGTAEHIKLSFAAGISHMETIDASESGNGSATVRIHGKALAASTTSAIT